MPAVAKVGLLIGALAMAVVAFLVVRPNQDGTSERAAQTAPTQDEDGRSPDPAAGQQQPQAGNGGEEKTPVLAVLAPGSVKTIQVENGERVRFAVRSTKADEAHVHGYDLLKKMPAGRTVRFDFRATLEGAFEIELELSGQRIGTLEVTP